MSVQSIHIIGNLGRAPETKFGSTGTAVTKFSVAVNEKWKVGTEEKSHTEWFNVVCFGKLGENCAKYLDKGREVYVEGRMRTRDYDKDGEKRYITELIARDVRFIGGNRQQQGGAESRPAEIDREDLPF